MKVGLGQIECVVGDVVGNCAVMVEMIGEAAARGCEVVWFPELADTGYGLSVMAEAAGAWPGLAFDAVSGAAAAHGIAVGCGLSERVGEREGGAVFNALAVFGPDGGLIGKYRKTHLFVAGGCDESTCFSAGSATQALDVGGWSHGLSVCYDLRFSELYRALSLSGASVLVNVSAWPSARPSHWDVLTRARAIENQAYFVGVARVGCDEGIVLNGRSRLVNPMGEVLVEAGGDAAELLVGEMAMEQVEAFRGLIPAGSHRRRDMFG